MHNNNTVSTEQYFNFTVTIITVTYYMNYPTMNENIKTLFSNIKPVTIWFRFVTFFYCKPFTGLSSPSPDW